MKEKGDGMIYTAEQLKKMWNDDADFSNDWEVLGEDEKLIHAQQCVIDRVINIELRDERDRPKATNQELIDLLKEARNEIAAYVEAAYPEISRLHFPVMHIRYSNEMEIVGRIDETIAKAGGGEAMTRTELREICKSEATKHIEFLEAGSVDDTNQRVDLLARHFEHFYMQGVVYGKAISGPGDFFSAMDAIIKSTDPEQSMAALIAKAEVKS